MVCSLVSVYFDSLNLGFNKNKLYKALDYWSRGMLIFHFSEMSLRLVSPPHFVYDVSIKKFLVLYYINWPYFIVWLPLLLEMLGNMSITIVCWPVCDIIKFEINLIFLIKLFCYMSEKSRQKFKYLENGKNFWGEIKSIFRHF